MTYKPMHHRCAHLHPNGRVYGYCEVCKLVWPCKDAGKPVDKVEPTYAAERKDAGKQA